MKKIIAIAAAALLCIGSFAQGKEYLASYFGIKSFKHFVNIIV